MLISLLISKRITEFNGDTFLCLISDDWGLKMPKPQGAGHTLGLLTTVTKTESKMADEEHTKNEPKNEKLKGLEWLKKRSAEITNQAQTKEKAQAPKQPENLPIPQWPEAARGVPNAFLRSAVFGAVRPGARAQLNNTLMPSPEGMEVRCTGERLDQSDLDTWITVLNLCSGHSAVRTTGYRILKELDLPDSGKNRETLEKRIKRLVMQSVYVKQGTKMYVGNLFAGAGRDDATGEWVIDTNPRMTEMLNGNNFTLIGWATRHRLAGQQLAQWLHGFYSSHAEPFPVRIETLHALSGSQALVMSDFAKTLRKAFEAVKAAFLEQGIPFDFEIAGGLVCVSKSPSPSQRKHITRKKSAADFLAQSRKF